MAKVRSPQTGTSRQLTMIQSGIGLMAGKGLAMALGFAYWLLAARLYPPEIVGITGAAIAGVMLVSQLGVVGLESAIVVLYPHDDEQRRDRLFDTAFTLVGLASLVAAGISAGVALAINGDLAGVVRDLPLLAMFSGMSIVAGVGIVLDQASMALRRGDHVVMRNGLNGLLSIVPLLIMWAVAAHGTGGASWLFGSWVLGATSGLLLGGWQLGRVNPPYTYMPRLRTELASGLVRTGIPNHLLTMTERVPILVLPLIVTERISPQANAYWYAVWMIAWATLVIGRSMSFALFAEVSRTDGNPRRDVPKSLQGALGLGAAAALVTVIAAPWVLALLGSDYAAAGTTPLRYVVVSFAPYTLVMTYFALCRASGKLLEATLFGALLAGSVVTAVAVATSGGLTRVAVAWLGVLTVFGLAAGARLWTLVRAREPGSADGSRAAEAR